MNLILKGITQSPTRTELIGQVPGHLRGRKGSLFVLNRYRPEITNVVGRSNEIEEPPSRGKTIENEIRGGIPIRTGLGIRATQGDIVPVTDRAAKTERFLPEFNAEIRRKQGRIVPPAGVRPDRTERPANREADSEPPA